jgi:hypothetical protein
MITRLSTTYNFTFLQFADDTIIVGKENWDNLWAIITVVRSFKLMSGLKVNFFKSNLYGINLEENFMVAASAFLHCGVHTQFLTVS